MTHDADGAAGFPHLRAADHRPVDAVDMSLPAQAARPTWRRIMLHPAVLVLGVMLVRRGAIVQPAWVRARRQRAAAAHRVG